MFIPGGLVTRSDSSQLPSTRCKPVSPNFKVCIGDLVAILGCAVAVTLFSVWAVHLLRKRRRAASSAQQQSTALDPYHVASPLNDSLLVKHGVVYPPIKPEKARTTDVFWSPTSHLPELNFKLSPPTVFNTTTGANQARPFGSLRRPPPLSLQSQATPSPRSSWARGDVSLLRDGAFGGRLANVDEAFGDGSPSRTKISISRNSTRVHGAGRLGIGHPTHRLV
ncbi:hypothetical protein HYDPIDRAFT_28509 [Hydnomerulius pinastri MD-312]|uniref:Uncharacterized protein n=1 Tax=Hydnomerulius pinastri MD-312 TaxID=994086 RepID=A0A0C9W155_9AGAM|nr:hypothetical protein HYDPIDRAFT_28509 [Hydnomerulius pinastri MD-312]